MTNERTRNESTPISPNNYRDAASRRAGASSTIPEPTPRNVNYKRKDIIASSRQTDDVQNGCQRHAEGKSIFRGQTWFEGRDGLP
jgi:hypothetical protein